MNFFQKIVDFFDPLSSLAKYTGIGGVALGVIFLVFKEAVRKALFSSLTKKQSYNIIRLIIIFCFVIAVVSLLIVGHTNKLDVKTDKFKDSINYDTLKLESKGKIDIDSSTKNQ